MPEQRAYELVGQETDNELLAGRDDNIALPDTKNLPSVRRAGLAARPCLRYSCTAFAVVSALLATIGTVHWWHWNRANEIGGACPISYEPAILPPITQAARAAFCWNPKQDGMYTWECPPCKDSGLRIVDGTFRPLHGNALWYNSTYAYVVRLADQQPLFSLFRSDPYAGACLLAFRGSSGVANVFSDIDFRFTLLPAKYNCPACLSHHGFFHAWATMEEGIVIALQDIGCQDRELIITGHSLGAAMATLAAWALTQVHGFELRMLYSFESPRVGDSAFHSFFNREIVAKKPAFRFTYYNDMVPHVPPKVIGFEHVNCEIYYDQHGQFNVCRDTEDEKCSNRWKITQTDSNMDGGADGDAHCHVGYISNHNMCWC